MQSLYGNHITVRLWRTDGHEVCADVTRTSELSMPILAKEPYLNPPGLLDDDWRASESEDRTWWALYTMSRTEKMLMRKLCTQEKSYYCPVIARRSKALRGASRTAYLPLFANYVFLLGNEVDRHAAVSTGHVSRVLPITDPASFVTQMRLVQQVIESGLDVELAPRFEVGTRVLVKSGPLKGVQGFVVKLRSRSRFVVQVDFLQQGASTVLDGWEIERV